MPLLGAQSAEAYSQILHYHAYGIDRVHKKEINKNVNVNLNVLFNTSNNQRSRSLFDTNLGSTF